MESASLFFSETGTLSFSSTLFGFLQCHYSYSACGLGSDGTDRLVNLVQEIQHRKGSAGASGTLFGAKITGGGSGGSVCVIGRNCVRSNEEILEVRLSCAVYSGRDRVFVKFVYWLGNPYET